MTPDLTVEASAIITERTMAEAVSRFSGLASRVITGVILAAVLLTCWWINGFATLALACVAVFLAQWEFTALFMHHDAGGKRVSVLSGVLGAAYCIFLFLFSAKTGEPALLTLFCFVFPLVFLFRFSSDDPGIRIKKTAILAIGFWYVAVLFGRIVLFAPWEQLLVIGIPIVSDIAAFFAGTRFGKHKIWSAVSPKKSVEGAAAGLAASVLLACAFYAAGKTNSFAATCALGFVLGCFAQLGDFFESALKRCAGVKDSGNLLPGHGGILDRIDSMIFAVAAYAAFKPILPF